MDARRIPREWMLRLLPLIAVGCYVLATLVLFVLGVIGLQARFDLLLGAYYLAFGLGWLGVFIIPALLLLQLAILVVWSFRRRAASNAGAVRPL